MPQIYIYIYIYIYIHTHTHTDTHTHITMRMLIACWILKAKNTYSQYTILTAFHCKNVCTKEPKCYVIRTLSVLLLYASKGLSPQFINVYTAVLRFVFC